MSKIQDYKLNGRLHVKKSSNAKKDDEIQKSKLTHNYHES